MFHMTIPAQHEHIVVGPIMPILVDMVNCENTRYSVVAALRAAFRSAGSETFALCLWAYLLLQAMCNSTQGDSASTRARFVSASFLLTQAYAIWLITRRTIGVDIGNVWDSCSKEFRSMGTIAFTRTKSTLPGCRWYQLKNSLTSNAHDIDFHPCFVVGQETPRSSRTVVIRRTLWQRLFAAASAGRWIGHTALGLILCSRSLAAACVRAISVNSTAGSDELSAAKLTDIRGFGGYSESSPVTTRNRAELVQLTIAMGKWIATLSAVMGDGARRSFVSLVDHRAFPTWQAVVWNVFGHGLGLLCEPFRRPSLALSVS